MTAHLRLGQIKDQPSAADVGAGKAELVADEGTKLRRLRRVEHGVDAFDHRSPPITEDTVARIGFDSTRSLSLDIVRVASELSEHAARPVTFDLNAWSSLPFGSY